MSVCCSPGHEDATFLPNCCVVSPQEIQDRIRIVELYAKDRQFADFVRQHQAWVALFAFTLSPKLGDEDSGRASWQGRGTLAKHFYMKGSGKIGFKIWFVWLAMALDAGAGVDLSLPRPPPAGPGGDTVRPSLPAVWQRVCTPSSTEVPSARRCADAFWALLCQ